MERRTYPRVDAYARVGVRVLPVQGQSAYFSEISEAAAVADIANSELNEVTELPELLSDLQERAYSLGRVLDSSDKADGFRKLEYKQLNLSGSGVRLLCNTMVSVKDIIELRMILPVQPPVPIFIYGEVVRVMETEDGYAAASEFIAVSDEIRRDIAQFVSSLLDAT
ncbi:PilZ domain-containing protein [Candidatus Magnetominusculus dajiuhuensis]|uniref:PilZ domain-containing protein n=1 Tax=Candidatus Magnetominusculus dajiuhuensis TaxID=3137712 RepID=UPI003B4369F6